MPTINSVAPANGFTADASTSASAQTLTVNGSNFVGSSSVLWNGAPLPGATVSGNAQITVPVPAGDLQASGTATVVVSNPAPGGGDSNAIVVNINPPTPANPVLAPGNATALSGGFELSVTANEVLYDSLVVWNCGNATCSNSDAIVLNTHLATPPSSTGGSGTLTAVVPNSLLAMQGAVPVAVATLDANGNITTAVSGTVNFNVTAPIAPACLLAGAGASAPTFRNYAFVATGSDKNGAASMVGSFRIDSSGAVVNAPLPNIVNSFADFKDPKNLFAATNNHGRMLGGGGSCLDTPGVPGVGKVVFTVNSISGDTFTVNYALRENGNGGRLTLTDSANNLKATGQFQIQFSTNAFNLGSFAFGLLGENGSAARYAVAGAMCTSSPVFLQADFADNQTAGSTVTGTASAWVLNNGDATTGRTTTSQLSFTNSRVLNLTLYGVNGGKAYAMESSPVAASTQVLSGVITGFKGPQCLATGNGGKFDNTALVNSVFGVSSQAGGTPLAVLGVVNNIAPVGTGSCAGQGSASLTADENANSSGGMIPPTTACYTVSAAGRTVLNYTDPLTNKNSGGVFYLDGAGSGYLIGRGGAIPYGFVTAQAAPAPVPPIGGNYGFAPFDFAGGLLGVTSVAINPATATSGTIADNTPGGSCNGAPCAYTLDTTSGRGTAILNSATTFGDTNLVFYEAGGHQLYIMGQTSATPVIGSLLQ
jgi:hypothetical protein